MNKNISINEIEKSTNVSVINWFEFDPETVMKTAKVTRMVLIIKDHISILKYYLPQWKKLTPEQLIEDINASTKIGLSSSKIEYLEKEINAMVAYDSFSSKWMIIRGTVPFFTYSDDEWADVTVNSIVNEHKQRRRCGLGGVGIWRNI